MIKLIFSILLISAAAGASTINTDDISIWIPDNWTSQNVQSAVFMAVAPVDGSFIDNVNIVSEYIGDNYTLDQYRKESIEEFMYIQSPKDKYRFNFDGADINRDDMCWRYSFLLRGDEVCQIQYFYLKNGTAYIMTFSSLLIDIEEKEPLFNMIRDSLVIK